MIRYTVVVLLVFLGLFYQHTFVGGWWFVRKKCSYPRPSQGSYYASYNDYFYGSTSLLKRGKIGGKKRDITSTFKPRHSILLFRGEVFEWGSKRYPWPTMGRNPSFCTITWSFYRKGQSMCTKSDIEQWNLHYVITYGQYGLFTNNCHHYVNRLAHKLDTDCGNNVHFPQKRSGNNNTNNDNVSRA